MERYMPPFTITNQMLMLVAEIAEKTGNISNFHSFETKPHLRRNNRIRSIHSSLAIEANSLSLDEVRSVISGKTVIGPQKEIQEVKNAYRAYEQIGRFDPYSLDDLKRLHGIMTHLTVQESGVFRSHNEGVFKGNQCIFMAPPPHLVPGQTEALFGWMVNARKEIHPLILSSVFHYEFVFIHPFSDGNGRMADCGKPRFCPSGTQSFSICLWKAASRSFRTAIMMRSPLAMDRGTRMHSSHSCWIRST